MIATGYIEAFGINYAGTIPKIKKSENQLQPLFEAITNSLEALKVSNKPSSEYQIQIEFYFKKTLLSDQSGEYEFDYCSIYDNGVGFNEDEFKRLISLHDNRKGFLNKGTGRVQYLHFFEKTEIDSVYFNASSDSLRRRTLELSKSKPFLDKNSIINFKSDEETTISDSFTKVIFRNLLSSIDHKFYSSLEIEDLKNEIVNRYLEYFCEKRNELPDISISYIVETKQLSRIKILQSDIPLVDHEMNLNVYYSFYKGGKKSEEQVEDFEEFNLKSFLIDKDKLNRNGLILVSKGELSKEVTLNSLNPNDAINNKRYLFLLSGDYIDTRDSDTRGDIKIYSQDELKSRSETLFNGKEITLEDIEYVANDAIENYYSEIKKKNEDKDLNIEKLKNMFLLNEETLKSMSISIHESDDEILKRVYQSDVKLMARRDARIKREIEELEKMNTKSPNYASELEEKVNNLVKAIPLQNRAALTRYVARRKLVLELFEKILNKQIDMLTSGGRIDEDLLHNLIFQQASKKPSESDLWIINEEFIYFKGVSEKRLHQIEVNGKKLFREQFDAEVQRYLNSLGEKRLTKRPDILLFPQEGKCIIIELKAPEVNASDHLTQIDKYANLILNYSKEEFKITRFYGYLIGENIEHRDVLGAVSSYEHSPKFNYLFRPSEKVTGFDGRENGYIYTEVIKYSTLLERAKMRNKIFIQKLTEDVEE